MKRWGKMSTVDLYQIELKLQSWGKWRIMHIKELCSGAPNKSAFCAVVGQDFTSRTYASHALLDLEAEETDKLVKMLAGHDKKLAEIISEKYTSEANDFTIIKKLGIFRATYYRKLKAAKSWLSKKLKEQKK
jgi:succinate dehydrogenase flavin-adding protein (antitoxin of CptAB toxin-antitoxin module)